MQTYSNSEREQDPHALPDVEVFCADAKTAIDSDALAEDGITEPGWYWWFCFPGCLPDSEPFGPFKTAELAVEDAQSNAEVL